MSTKNLFGRFEQIQGITYQVVIIYFGICNFLIKGFDLSDSMIEEARQCWSQYSENVSFEVGRAEAIPLPDNSTQLILVGRAIHYFDHKTFFEEADRILVNIYDKNFLF